MTPFAMKLARWMADPRRSAALVPYQAILAPLPDVHCFDVSAVVRLAQDLAKATVESGVIDGRLAFLPAPSTWIEFETENFPGWRHAWLLTEAGEGQASVSEFAMELAGGMRFFGERAAPLTLLHANAATERVTSEIERWHQSRPKMLDDEMLGDLHSNSAVLYALLAIINTPKLIGRRVKRPNVTLGRQLAKAGLSSRRSLPEWTEIVLEVPAMEGVLMDGADQILIGRKAYHFCRQHIRIRNGRLELVRAHWRGDPSLGVRRSRYRLAEAAPRLHQVEGA